MNEGPLPQKDLPGKRDRLSFLACGSLGDGKSTLIERLFYEVSLLLEKEPVAPESDWGRPGAAGEGIGFPLFADPSQEKAGPGKAIDVACRSFATPRRAFLAIEAPGGEEEPSAIALAASNCDLAVILLDARKGVLRETKRQAFISSLLGVRRFVLAVNKMDLAGFEERRFEAIAAGFSAFASALSVKEVDAIPLSALFGDNLMALSPRMPWYKGPSLLDLLERVAVSGGAEERPLRFSVEGLNRPRAGWLGLKGRLLSGSLSLGERVLAAGSGRASEIKEMIGPEGKVTRARAGESVTLLLPEEIGVAPGDLLADPKNPPDFADQFAAHILWLSEEALVSGRSYSMKIGARRVAATVTALKHRIDVDTLAHLAERTLRRNEIGFCNLSAAEPVAFDACEKNRETGVFLLLDRFTNETAGLGVIAFALRRASNIHWQALTVGRAERAAIKGQVPAVLWFTGLSGAGKSTIADLVEKKLHAKGRHTMLLDGDNLRHGLNRDLGFTDADRVENIRRVGEVARLLNEAGLIVLCSFISPFRAERRMVRDAIEPLPFLEIYVDTPLEECMRRDPKGLYQKAQRGEIRNFTGFDSPYEPPHNPELHLLAGAGSPETLAERILDALESRGIL